VALKCTFKCGVLVLAAVGSNKSTLLNMALCDYVTQHPPLHHPLKNLMAQLWTKVQTLIAYLRHVRERKNITSFLLLCFEESY
jgi:hypothetical protein